MPGPHLVRLSSSKVIILRGCLCGHFPSNPGDVEQEVSKELNRAEPKTKSRLIQQLQGQCEGLTQHYRLKTARNVPRTLWLSLHGDWKTSFICSHYPLQFPSFLLVNKLLQS